MRTPRHILLATPQIVLVCVGPTIVKLELIKLSEIDAVRGEEVSKHFRKTHPAIL